MEMDMPLKEKNDPEMAYRRGYLRLSACLLIEGKPDVAVAVR
jgi:hypothetical protein